MPHNTPEKRREYRRKRYHRLRLENPDVIEKEKERQRKAHARKAKEDATYLERKRAAHKKWYDLYGKDYMREHEGYIPLEEYLEQLEAKRKYKREYMRKWNVTDKGQRSRTAKSIKKRCGLTIEEYDRTYDEQDGKCAICEKPASRYGQDRLVVDHCHDSGRFRALLCTPCNTGIGMFRESDGLLERAIQYLRRQRMRIA